MLLAQVPLEQRLLLNYSKHILTLYLLESKNTLNYFPENGHQSKTISVTPYQDITPPLDIVFIAVKTYQLETVITQLSPIIHEETIIILAQNGYGQLERIPFPNSYQAVVYISGQKITMTSLILETIAFT